MKRLAAALVALVHIVAAPAHAAVLSATPVDLVERLKASNPGDTVRVTGVIGNVALKNIVKAAPGVTIDLSGASLQGQLGLYGSSRLTIEMPQCHAPVSTRPTATWDCILINTSSNITVKDGTFKDAVTGIGIQQSNHVTITGNVLHTINDGVDVIASQFVDFERNQCLAASPSAGHADCLQVWNLAGQPISSDITIAWNTAVGYLQGFDGDGSPLTLEGTARVNMHDNVYAGTMQTAGGFGPCSDCQMVGNTAFTLTVTANAAPGWNMICAPYGAGAVMAVPCAPANRPIMKGNVNGQKFEAQRMR